MTKQVDFNQTRLVMALTEMDRQESAREAKRGRVNIYRLSHYLGAAERIAADIAAGTPAHVAFADHFNASAGTHRIAKSFGWPLDVERGQWVIRG